MKKTLVLALAATTTLGSAALADGHAITEFRIGLLGGENAQDRVNAYQCLADYASEALGVPVKIFTPADYNGVIQGLLGGTLDMSWLGASSYAATYLQDPEAVEPVLVKVNLDGSIGYHSIGFARKDSGIASLDDMEGKVFGFGDPNSTSSFNFPFAMVIAADVDPAKDLSKIVIAGSHTNSIAALQEGRVDAAAASFNAWEKAVKKGVIDPTVFRVLAKS